MTTFDVLEILGAGSDYAAFNYFFSVTLTFGFFAWFAGLLFRIVSRS
jgi:hypothetical protein